MAGAEIVFTDSTLALKGPMNFKTVTEIYVQAEQALKDFSAHKSESKKLTIDCLSIVDADSSVISLLLALSRFAQNCSLSLDFVNLSEQMQSLITLYELDWLLGAKKGA